MQNLDIFNKIQKLQIYTSDRASDIKTMISDNFKIFLVILKYFR